MRHAGQLEETRPITLVAARTAAALIIAVGADIVAAALLVTKGIRTKMKDAKV